jgi:bifunctional DNA-binding transcriptional regulator/antitoxin component of YhaV-PrlF toxin-antitoxin module
MGAEPMLVKPTARGMLTLPKELRADWDENTLLDVILRPDGVIDAADTWWRSYWPTKLGEAEADVKDGREQTFDDAESLITYLESTVKDIPGQ